MAKGKDKVPATQNKYVLAAVELTKKLKEDVPTIPDAAHALAVNDTGALRTRAQMLASVLRHYETMPELLKDFVPLYRNELCKLNLKKPYASKKDRKWTDAEERGYNKILANYVSPTNTIIRTALGLDELTEKKPFPKVIEALESEGTFAEKMTKIRGFGNPKAKKRAPKKKKAPTQETTAPTADDGDGFKTAKLVVTGLKTADDVIGILEVCAAMLVDRTDNKKFAGVYAKEVNLLGRETREVIAKYVKATDKESVSSTVESLSEKTGTDN